MLGTAFGASFEINLKSSRESRVLNNKPSCSTRQLRARETQTKLCVNNTPSVPEDVTLLEKEGKKRLRRSRSQLWVGHSFGRYVQFDVYIEHASNDKRYALHASNDKRHTFRQRARISINCLNNFWKSYSRKNKTCNVKYVVRLVRKFRVLKTTRLKNENDGNIQVPHFTIFLRAKRQRAIAAGFSCRPQVRGTRNVGAYFGYGDVRRKSK